MPVECEEVEGVMDINRIEGKKREIAEAVRTLAGGGILTLTLGHVSWRDEETGNILILGHTHKKDKFLTDITEEDIILIDGDGGVISGNYDPPGEVFIHTEIYRARKDVCSVFHGHPDKCIAFSLANVPMFPVYYRATQFFPEVPVFDYAGQINTKEKGRECAELLGDNAALLLRGHGIITVGQTIQEAAVNAFSAEKNASLILEASCLGEIKPINSKDLHAHRPTSVWPYYVDKYDALLKRSIQK